VFRHRTFYSILFIKLAAIHRYERPAGLFITVYVYIVYLIALRFEGCVLLKLIISRPLIFSSPFTDMIYSKRAEKAKAKAL
jgi:methylene-fatty-acyl-phospholipid synthase